MMPPPTQSEAGYALLDAMVALAILGIILGLFIQVAQSSLLVRARAADSRQAILIAQARLAEALESDEPEPSGRDGAFAWRTQTARYPGTDNGHGLEQVTVIVSQGAQGRTLARLSTLRLAR